MMMTVQLLGRLDAASEAFYYELPEPDAVPATLAFVPNARPEAPPPASLPTRFPPAPVTRLSGGGTPLVTPFFVSVRCHELDLPQLRWGARGGRSR